ncbi:hypothetical protein [Intestinibacter bartlettii]|uniref:Chromosome partition protein Smc n=1 Tax=Intestinibacter bartlettii TaxID=261299 RepID=A0ABS6DWC9_9FIRM|nr:hypothetical protein [Intestinibacter bartlettii]MBU5336156.1 hypothetical protein [Intestinibacter bartlettii]
MARRGDVTYFIIEALSKTEKSYRHIDKIYNKDKEKYSRLAREDKFYKLSINGTLIQEDYYKKLCGIRYEADNIIDVLKKTYKKAAKYVENHYVIRLGELFLEISRQMHKYTKAEVDGELLAAIILSYEYNKKLDNNDIIYSNKLKLLQNRYETFWEKPVYAYENLEKEEKRRARALLEKVKKQYDTFDIKTIGVNNIDIITGIVPSKKILPKKGQVVALDYIYDLDGVDIISLVGRDYVTEKEVIELINLYVAFQVEDEISIKKLYTFLIAGIKIRYLLKAYNKDKEYYFKNINQDLDDIIADKNKEISFLKQERDIKDKQLNDIEVENKKLKEEIQKLKKENNNLKNEIQSFPDTKEELSQLRNLMFTLNREQQEAEKHSVDVEEVDKLKAICFGGTSKWIQKMKQHFPNWIYVPAGAEQFDVKLLKGKEYIFINTVTNSHGLYYRIIENKAKNSKIRYINNLNTDVIIQEIANNL